MITIKSENAVKGKLYHIKKKDHPGRYYGMPGAREFRVSKLFEDTDTGVIMKNVRHGYTLDIPVGYVFEEVI